MWNFAKDLSNTYLQCVTGSRQLFNSVLVKGRFKSVIQLLEANEIFHSVKSLES